MKIDEEIIKNLSSMNFIDFSLIPIDIYWFSLLFIAF